MPTHRAKVTFRAKEGEPEPCILVEQLGGDADIVPDNFYFDLPRGTSLKESRRPSEEENEVRPLRRNTERCEKEGKA